MFLSSHIFFTLNVIWSIKAKHERVSLLLNFLWYHWTCQEWINIIVLSPYSNVIGWFVHIYSTAHSAHSDTHANRIQPAGAPDQIHQSDPVVQCLLQPNTAQSQELESLSDTTSSKESCEINEHVNERRNTIIGMICVALGTFIGIVDLQTRCNFWFLFFCTSSGNVVRCEDHIQSNEDTIRRERFSSLKLDQLHTNSIVSWLDCTLSSRLRMLRKYGYRGWSSLLWISYFPPKYHRNGIHLYR